jgi:N-acetylglucosamine-6-phosphate deacetylase
MPENVFAFDVESGDVRSVAVAGSRFIEQPAPPDAQPTPGVYVSPGFLDVQVNGFAGVDYNSPQTTLDEIARSLEVIRKTGVTRFFPTVITGPREQMVASLRNLTRAQEELSPDGLIAGFHVEGPHISPEEGPRGAHPLPSVRPPDFAEYLDWQEATRGQVRIITVSAHWDTAPDYIERVVSAGTTVSIGHTHASAEQIETAVNAGATMSTHLGNAAHQTLPKLDNYVWHQLADDRLTASFIVDGIHLPSTFVKSAIRAKTLDRSVLVTDASSPAGADPGRYRLGEQEVDLTPDGRVVLAGQDRLAGSALQLQHAISNTIRFAGISLSEAIRLATRNPARAAQLPEFGGRVLLMWNGDGIDIIAANPARDSNVSL